MMQKCLSVSLCVLATFALIEAKPMYGNDGGYGYNGEYQGYRADYSSQSRFSVDQYRGGQGGGGFGGGGQGNGGYGGGGQGSGGYGSGGYGGVQFSGGYGSGRGPYNPGGNRFMPDHCPNCKIRNYGNGDYNTNTFNIPREAYN